MGSSMNMINFSEEILTRANVLINEMTYLSVQVNYCMEVLMVTWQIGMPPFERIGVKGRLRRESFVGGQIEGYRVLQTVPGNKQVPRYT